jgi:hypothetical protein
MVFVTAGGTVRVSVSASDIKPESDDESSANVRRRKQVPESDEEHEKTLIRQINIELLEATQIEVRNLRKVCSSGVEPKHIAQRRSLLRSIRLLTKYRREITGVYEGSVIICVKCPSTIALTDLWDSCVKGRLQKALRTDFVTRERLQRFRLTDFDIRVSIDLTDYQLACHEMNVGCPQLGKDNFCVTFLTIALPAVKSPVPVQL